MNTTKTGPMMNHSTGRRVLPAIALMIAFLVSAIPARGWQNVSYEALASQSDRAPILNEHYTLPGSEADQVLFVTSFSIPYRSLPFHRIGRGSAEQYRSVVGMSIEFFEADAEDLQRPERVSVDGREPEGRATWSDTATVDTYEATQSETSRLEGDFRVNLKPGYYSYVMQITRGEGTAGVTSEPQVVRVGPPGERRHGDILVGTSNGDRFELLNIGNRVRYAEDYQALVALDGHREGDRYRLQIHHIQITEDDTTRRESVYEQELGPNEIRTGMQAVAGGEPATVILREAGQGTAVAVTGIPNRRFPNDTYRISVTRNGEPLAQRVIRSWWPDMPVSLLNLDVAIDMLRFIESSDRIREIKRGSRSDRERNFRQYWSDRDPTPDTEFNELMTEFYRRIDYTWEEFTAAGTPGFETDMGEIYIRYGPPQERERTFPSGEPAMERWTYPSRTFVFRATSGFGEFELVSR